MNYEAFGRSSLPFLLTMAVLLGGRQLLGSFRVCWFSHRMLPASERKPVPEDCEAGLWDIRCGVWDVRALTDTKQPFKGQLKVVLLFGILNSEWS